MFNCVITHNHKMYLCCAHSQIVCEMCVGGDVIGEGILHMELVLHVLSLFKMIPSYQEGLIK